MPNFGGDASGGDAGFGADVPMTFSRRVGGQVSVPMHMHPLTDPLAQQAAHYQAYADRSDPYAFGFTAGLNSHNAPQRHSQSVHAADGGYARGNRQSHARRSGGLRGQAAGAVPPPNGKQATFVQRIVESISKRWLTNRPLVIGIGFLMLVTVLTLWSTTSASASPTDADSSFVSLTSSDSSADIGGVADGPLLSNSETHLAAKTLELAHDVGHDVGHDDGI